VIVWVNSVMIMFGQMAPSYLLWNGGILQLQDAIRVKIAAVLGCLAQVPHSYRAVREVRTRGRDSIVCDDTNAGWMRRGAIRDARDGDARSSDVERR